MTGIDLKSVGNTQLTIFWVPVRSRMQPKHMLGDILHLTDLIGLDTVNSELVST